MQRLLDGIERLGNKMPDPAILFVWLCIGVIVLSQVLMWLDVKATYEVVKPPPVPAQETYYGGSTDSVYVGPTAHEPAAEILLVGTTDGYANIHAPDERVLVDELEKAIVAEAGFFERLAAR